MFLVGYPESRSEFQASGEVEPVSLDGLADIEVVDPPRVQIEMAFTNLRRVGNVAPVRLRPRRPRNTESQESQSQQCSTDYRLHFICPAS